MKKNSFWKLLNETTVVVPAFQRDYAQGRRTPKETGLRTEFVKNLLEALDNKNEVHLDFIYGTYDNEGFKPLDGQQRLTTLYLLHLYLALQAGYSNKDIFQKFRYETRQSSTDFCRDIIKGWDIKQTPSEAIKDQAWYALSWDQDPTIVGMLSMLDAIHAEFTHNYSGKALEFWEKITNEDKDNPIFFHVLDYKDEKFKLFDELYIKMNARGRPLTPFENFKASFLGFIGKELGEDEKKHLGNRFDKEWTDFFWDYTRPNIVDDNFKNFLDYISCLLYYKQGGSQNDLPNGFEFYREVYSTEDNFKFVFGKGGVLSKLSILKKDGVERLFEAWFTDQRQASEEKVFIQREKGKQNLLDAEGGVFKNGAQDSEGDRFLYFLFCILAKIDSSPNKDAILEKLSCKEFLLKLRILRNLIWNTVTNNDNLKAHLDFIETFVTSQVQESLRSTTAFNPNQKDEEVKKLGYSGDKFEKIKYLENHPILLGTVNAFLEHDTYLTDGHINNFYALFKKEDKDGDQFTDSKNLLRRALLYFSQMDTDGKTIKSWYMVENSGHCDLCRDAAEWKKSFTSRFPIYFKLLDDYAIHQGDTNVRLGLIIEQKSEDVIKFPDWLQKCINLDLFEGIKKIDLWDKEGKNIRLMVWNNYHSYSVGLYPLIIEKILATDSNYSPQWIYKTYAPEWGKFTVNKIEIQIYYEYEHEYKKYPLYSLWIENKNFPPKLSSFKFEKLDKLDKFKKLDKGEWHYIDNISEEKIGKCIEQIKKTLE